MSTDAEWLSLVRVELAAAGVPLARESDLWSVADRVGLEDCHVTIIGLDLQDIEPMSRRRASELRTRLASVEVWGLSDRISGAPPTSVRVPFLLGALDIVDKAEFVDVVKAAMRNRASA
jgi:hypothetical protein